MKNKKHLDILIWHGNENIAAIDNLAGEKNPISYMFDDDRFTYWESNPADINIGFNFRVNTGEVTSKVAVIVSISRQSWLIYVG